MLDVYHKLPVSHDLDDGKVRSKDVVIDSQVKFSTLLIESQIHVGLVKCGYIYLSPIQQNSLPLTITGSSVIAHAKSGTGKTLIFVLTVLNDFLKRNPSSLQYLILAPTREIAKQIYDVFQNVASSIKGLQIEFFIGGTPLDIDVIKCKNCNVAIGAPGRIKHLIDLGFLKTTDLQLLVLDEVDALFEHEEYAILDIISHLPPFKQLIVCTATFTSKIGEMVKSVAPNIRYISTEKSALEDVSKTSNMLIAVKQYVAPIKKESSSVEAMKKRDKLVQILQNFQFEQCFIFVNYISLVKSICNLLTKQNFAAVWISSEQNQSARINTINKLKMNHCKILVTTDLAARGIDVHNVTLVINLGLPSPADVYIHRMGRAGRFGSEGAVITILCEGEEMETFTKMMSVISTDPVDLHVLPENIESHPSNLEVICCLPSKGSISDDEFTIKRFVKDNSDRINEKPQKSNKKSKKQKTKTANNMYMSLSQNSFNDSSVETNDSRESSNYDEEQLIDPVVVRQKIDQFTKSLADRLAAEEPSMELDSLKFLIDSVGEGIAEKDSSLSAQNLYQSLLTYAQFAKQRNELIDEQIMPCTVNEFLSALEDDDGPFNHLHSFGLRGLIKEITAKIGNKTKQKPKVCQPVSLVNSGLADSPQQKNSSQVSSVNLSLEQNDNDTDKKSCFQQTFHTNRLSGAYSLADEFFTTMTGANGVASQNTVRKTSPKITLRADPSNLSLNSVNNSLRQTSSQPTDGDLVHNSTILSKNISLSDQLSNDIDNRTVNNLPAAPPGKNESACFNMSAPTSKNETQHHENKKGIQSKIDSNLNLSGLLLDVIGNTTADTFEEGVKSPNKLSTNSLRVESVLNGEKPTVLDGRRTPQKLSSTSFNELSSEFSSTLSVSCREKLAINSENLYSNKPDSEKQFHGLSHNDNDTIPANGTRENKSSSKLSPSNLRLSNQFLNSVDDTASNSDRLNLSGEGDSKSRQSSSQDHRQTSPVTGSEKRVYDKLDARRTPPKPVAGEFDPQNCNLVNSISESASDARPRKGFQKNEKLQKRFSANFSGVKKVEEHEKQMFDRRHDDSRSPTKAISTDGNLADQFFNVVKDSTVETSFGGRSNQSPAISHFFSANYRSDAATVDEKQLCGGKPEMKPALESFSHHSNLSDQFSNAVNHSPAKVDGRQSTPARHATNQCTVNRSKDSNTFSEDNKNSHGERGRETPSDKVSDDLSVGKKHLDVRNRKLNGPNACSQDRKGADEGSPMKQASKKVSLSDQFANSTYNNREVDCLRCEKLANNTQATGRNYVGGPKNVDNVGFSGQSRRTDDSGVRKAAIHDKRSHSSSHSSEDTTSNRFQNIRSVVDAPKNVAGGPTAHAENDSKRSPNGSVVDLFFNAFSQNRARTNAHPTTGNSPKSSSSQSAFLSDEFLEIVTKLPDDEKCRMATCSTVECDVTRRSSPVSADHRQKNQSRRAAAQFVAETKKSGGDAVANSVVNRSTSGHSVAKGGGETSNESNRRTKLEVDAKLTKASGPVPVLELRKVNTLPLVDCNPENPPSSPTYISSGGSNPQPDAADSVPGNRKTDATARLSNLNAANGGTFPSAGSNTSSTSRLQTANRHPVVDQRELPAHERFAAMLPSLRTYVSAEQEQNIWLHHLAFVRRCVSRLGVSRSDTTN